MGLTEAHQVSGDEQACATGSRCAPTAVAHRARHRDGGDDGGRGIRHRHRALIAMGCIMVRQCQSNTCPVGVVRRTKPCGEVHRYGGQGGEPDHVLCAGSARNSGGIGARSLDDVIGRADLLSQVSRGSAHLDDLDLNPLLITSMARTRSSMTATSRAMPCRHAGREIVAMRAVPGGRRKDATGLCSAEHAPDGWHAQSSHIVQRFGMRNTLQPDHLTVKLTGVGGQSLGAFAAPG